MRRYKNNSAFMVPRGFFLRVVQCLTAYHFSWKAVEGDTVRLSARMQITGSPKPECLLKLFVL
jgi:hypothetical protein